MIGCSKTIERLHDMNPKGIRLDVSESQKKNKRKKKKIKKDKIKVVVKTSNGINPHTSTTNGSYDLIV